MTTPLRVLLTRPAGQGGALLQRLQQAGVMALHFPLLAIEGLDPVSQPVDRQRIMDLDNYQQVIFISGNAVQHGVAWIEQYWPQLPVGIHWRGIGAATLSAMAAAGLPLLSASGDANNIAMTDAAMTDAAMNSEALLQHDGMTRVEGQKILIVRGQGGREYLAQQLRRRGAQVDYAECYRRCLPAASGQQLGELLLRQGINVVCLNSAQTLDNFFHSLGPQAESAVATLVALLPSQRVAERARNKGFQRIVVADNASDEAVYGSILALANGAG